MRRSSIPLFLLLLFLVPGALAQSAEDLYREGVDLERVGRYLDARERYRAALEEDPTDPRFHLAMGRISEPESLALALYHYQMAFKYAIEDAGETIPILPRLRSFLVDRYLGHALPIEDPYLSIRLLQSALVLDPDNPSVREALAAAYFVDNDYERSLAEARTARALGLEGGMSRLNIAAPLLQMGRIDEAEEEIRAALETDEFEFRDLLSALLNESDDTAWIDFREAFPDGRIEELIDNSTDGRLYSAVTAWGRGETETAIEKAREAAEGNPSHSYSLVYLGDFLRLSGDTRGAREAYSDALARRPDNIVAEPRLGELEFAEGNYDEAAERLAHYLSRDDLSQAGLGEVVLTLARAEAEMGRISSAVGRIDDWLLRYPNHPDAILMRLGKAYILDDAGRTGEARTAYRDVVENHPLDARGYSAAYHFLTENGERDAARSMVNDGLVLIQRATDANSADPSLYMAEADLYSLMGRDRAAIEALKDGGTHVQDPRPFANALYSRDAETEALEVTGAWLDRDPSSIEAVLYYGWIAAEVGLDLDNALSMVNALEDDLAGADLTPLYRTRSYLYFAMGRYDDCIDEIDRFLSSDDIREASFFHRLLGLSFEALGNDARAISEMETAVELDPDENGDLLEHIERLRAD